MLLVNHRPAGVVGAKQDAWLWYSKEGSALMARRRCYTVMLFLELVCRMLVVMLSCAGSFGLVLLEPVCYALPAATCVACFTCMPGTCLRWLQDAVQMAAKLCPSR